MNGDERPGRWALVAAIVIGLVVGGGGAAGGLAVLQDDTAVDPEVTATPISTTTTVEAPPDPVWISRREVVIGSTALVPTGLVLDSGQLSLNYELFSIAPALDDDIAADVDPPELVFPTTWTAVTTRGEIIGSTVSVNARRAVFTFPEDLTLTDVLDIRLNSYRVPVPFSFPLPIPLGDASAHEIVPGISARVESVLEQRENAIVTVELISDDGFLISDIVVDGTGPEWVRASRSQLGRPTWTLDYRGSQLPDPIPLRAHGILWSQIDDPRSVDIEGLAG